MTPTPPLRDAQDLPALPEPDAWRWRWKTTPN